MIPRWEASLLLAALCGCATGWRGPSSDHFDGERFHSLDPGPRDRGLGDFLKWQLERDPGPWAPPRDVPPGPPPPYRVALGQMRVTLIGHATTLIQLDGVNVLTDPIYSERASPLSFLGPRRVRPPAIRFEDLPPIHAVVVSHNHYDHLDVPTLRRIAKTWPQVRIFVGLGNKAFLEAQGLEHVEELDWWQSREVRGVTVTSVPSQHFSNRGLFDGARTLWTAWVLGGRYAGRAYFGGDTAFGSHFEKTGAALGPFRLAVLPVGAYKPEWFMSPVHMGPTQAVEAASLLRAKSAVPMHHGTFQLADDGETEAIDVLRRHPGVFQVLGFGDGLTVPP
ncbi:MAG: MBL fold metallo-hydrolase [Myxococcaceae bacterium]|nr:MBL fold metallo-hydrolase [Myxococcaceae bacterium]